jgi:hypothetical protein
MLYDEESGQLEFANDALGLLPFYYCSGPDFFAFGARYYSFRFVHRFKRQLDMRAIGDLMQLGYVIGDRTLYAQAHRMPAGSILRCEPDYRVRVTKVARLSYSRERWHTSMPELASQMGDILLTSLRATVNTNRPAIVPLSGGLDSRVVATLATKLRFDCRAVSFGSSRYLDTSISQRVARELGMGHSVLPLHGDGIAHYLPRHLRVTEGTVDPTGWYWFALVDAVGESMPTILPGHLGDAISGAHLRAHCDGNPTPDSVFNAVFDAAIKKEGGFTAAELAECMTIEAYSECGDATRADSRQVFFSNGECNFQRLLNWDLMLRQRLFICVDMTIEDCAGPVVCPFTDMNLLRFVASLPYDALRSQRVYCEMLKLLMPSLARISLADSRRPPQSSRREALWLALGEPEKLVGWRLGRMARRLGIARDDKDWWATVYGGSPGLDGLLADSAEQLNGLFRPTFLADLMSIHPARRRKLALLAKWLESYA